MLLRFLILSNVYAVFLLLPYLLFLRDKTHHRWSRIYLLSVLICSILLPLTNIKFASYGVQAPQVFQTIELSAGVKNSYQSVVESNTHWAWIIYLSIGCLFLLLLLFKFYRLYQLLKQQEFYILDGCKIAKNTGYGPASFGRYILFPHETINPVILQHEKEHYNLLHHWDKTFIELMQVAFPLLLPLPFIRKELNTIHEFEADSKVAENISSYAELLLQHEFTRHISLQHTFFSHPIKRRIMMLQKNKIQHRLYKIVLLPMASVIIITMLFFQSGCSSLEKKKQEVVPAKVDLKQAPEPTFDAQKYLSKNLSFSNESIPIDTKGTVVASFVINVDGKVSGVKILKSLSPVVDKEVEKVIKEMPDWIPAKDKNDNAIAFTYQVPIEFGQEDPNEKETFHYVTDKE